MLKKKISFLTHDFFEPVRDFEAEDELELLPPADWSLLVGGI
jgi:hypothetical protein